MLFAVNTPMGWRATTSSSPPRRSTDGDEPDVSVVVTLFNYAGVVSEALDSIVASTDISSEIIVVDDHSTDDGRDSRATVHG